MLFKDHKILINSDIKTHLGLILKIVHCIVQVLLQIQVSSYIVSKYVYVNRFELLKLNVF